MKRTHNYFVAQEDTDTYNVFGFDDFDENGYLHGHKHEEGYHLRDFDIVEIFIDFEEAINWVERHTM